MVDRSIFCVTYDSLFYPEMLAAEKENLMCMKTGVYK
jgi:hypothetical protein